MASRKRPRPAAWQTLAGEASPAPMPPRARKLAPVPIATTDAGPPTAAEALGQVLSMIVQSNSAPPGTRAVSLYCSLPMTCPACQQEIPAWTPHRCQQ